MSIGRKQRIIRQVGAIGLSIWLGSPLLAHAEVRPPAATFSIGNFVWHDVNNNGLVDGGETGVAGVNLRLYDVTGTQFLANTYTNTQGQYQFTNLQAGQYIVELILPMGYISSSGKNGSVTGPYEPAPDPNNLVDNDDNGTFFSPESLRSAPIDLSRTSVNQAVDFGIYQSFSVGNRVWHDYNNNGVIDAADGSNPGIDEVQVQLWDMVNRVVVASVTTANGGYYRFDSLIAGEYVVELPATNFAQGPLMFYMSSQNTESDPDNDIDNNDNGINSPYLASHGLKSGRITIGTARAPREPVGEFDLSVGGQGTVIDQRANMTIDFGFFRTASIGDRVWMDSNANGMQDPDEKGIPGVTVVLNSQKYGSSSTVTDAQGHYTFTNLIPGEQYQVIFSPLNGYLRSPHITGDNDDFDSDADATGQTRWLTLRGGEDITTLDAGFYAPGMKAATATPTPLPVAILPSPTPLPTFTPLSPEVFKAGAASIEVAPLISPTPLPRTESVIAAAPDAAPSSYQDAISRASPNTNEAIFNHSGAEVLSVNTPIAVYDFATPTPNPSPTLVPIEARGSIGDRVWNDANHNGVQDVGESGIEGVVINVYSQDGALFSTTTDAEGKYTLAGLMPFTPYTVSFKLPGGYTFTTANVHQDDSDSDADPVTGLIRGLVIWPGEINNTIDAGAYEILPRRATASPTPPPSPTPKLPSIGSQPESSVLGNNASAYVPPSPTVAPKATRAPAVASAPRATNTPRQRPSTNPRPPIVRQPVQPAPAAQIQPQPPVVPQNPTVNGVRPPPPIVPPNAIIIPPVNSATSPRSVLILQGP